jgi:2-isopropylmalate synthase
MSKGDDWLADRVYSGVPAGLFGLKQVIEIGHMAGRSNVVCWLQQRDVEPDSDLVDAIFTVAKAGNRNLTTDEVWAVINQHQASI